MSSIPTNIEFTFDFSDIDTPVDINNAIIQQYPNYLSLINDTEFFVEVNNKLFFLHEVQRIHNGIGEIQTYVNDSQGRTFQVDLLHQSGVPT